MAEITGKTENGILTLFAKGRIDSANAADTEGQINQIIADYSDPKLIIDADELEFISSVGLRIVLRLKKAHKELSVINVQQDVYEVFDMTGFTEMMDIHKAYRRMSIDGCEAIGEGSNGVVYRLDSDTIIKVYRNPDSLPDIHRERELARKAFVLGIPTAIPYDVVKVGNSYGSVFELLNAKSFAKIIKAQPERLDEVVAEFVRVLKQIHSTEIKPGEIPEEKSVVIKWVKDLENALPKDQFDKLYSLVDAVPDRNTLIHGDYHFKNVMEQNGETLLIDMDTLCTGHPVFEFASVFLANVGFGEVDHSITENFMGIPYETTLKIWDKTLRLYFETEDEAELANYASKAKVVGYTRLLRRTLRREPDNIKVIENCKNNLEKLLSEVDSLVF